MTDVEKLSVAVALADWAANFMPREEDLVLAKRSLVDTVVVALAARSHPIVRTADALTEAGQWAAACHVLDFDDLHMPSTTHISAICVPAALATGSGEQGYLVGAGVMARLGEMLGWTHYSSGWHSTTTTGAIAAAVIAAHSHGLATEGIARAMALAVPAAGGVQRSFGTDTKSLQVGFAVEAGLRAARLAANGASADPTSVDTWLSLVQGSSVVFRQDESAVTDGLAIKIFPCCYALQRPIAAVATIRQGLSADEVQRIVIRTPESTVAPLIYSRPTTGLQAKFSLEYAVAAGILDDYVGFESFTDDAVSRPAARCLVELVEVELTRGGDSLLSGQMEVELSLRDATRHVTLDLPPGSPGRPPSGADLDQKSTDCLRGLDLAAVDLSWDNAVSHLRAHLGAGNLIDIAPGR